MLNLDTNRETAQGPAGRDRDVQTPLGFSGSVMSSSILKLATSQGIVIAISFATAPILGRLFLPHAYGSLGVLGTILLIIASFASLSYVSAIPLAASSVERRNLFALCSIIGILATGVVTVGSFLGANLLAAAFHEPAVAKYALFLPLMFLAGAVRQLLDTTLGCQKRFSTVAIRNILEISVTRVSQLGLCLSSLLGSPVALILGSLAGSLVAALTSGVACIRDVFQVVKEPLHLAGLRAAAVTYRKFPLVQLWSVTLNALTFGLPAIVLGVRYSVEVVGLYNMAFTMAALPLQLFIGGANQVFYVEAGERVAHRQSVAPPTMHLVRVIAILASMPLATVLILGPLLFEIFLGPKWREAGVFAQVLVPWMSLMAVSGPLSVVYAVLNRQGEGFFWNIALLSGRFSALFFGGMFFGVRATLGLFVAISVLLVAGFMWRSLFLLGVSRSWAAKTLARAYVAPLLLLAPAGILYWGFSARFSALGALAMACAAYAVVIYLRHPEIIKPLLARVPVAWATRFGKPSGARDDDK